MDIRRFGLTLVPMKRVVYHIGRISLIACGSCPDRVVGFDILDWHGTPRAVREHDVAFYVSTSWEIQE